MEGVYILKKLAHIKMGNVNIKRQQIFEAA